MNKEEFKKQRRIFRAAISCISRGHLRLQRDEHDRVWDLFWEGIYQKMPPEVYYTLVDRDKTWTHCIENKNQIRCNMRYCPNSYPHKTKNP